MAALHRPGSPRGPGTAGERLPGTGRFGPLWTASTAFLLLASLLARAPWLAALALLVVVVGLSSRFWAAMALRRVNLALELSASRVFVGDALTLTVTLANDKPLPLGWLRARVELPRRLLLSGARLEPSDQQGSQVLSLLTALGPYQRMVWRYRLDCPRRGHYLFRGALLESGDLFGFERRVRRFPGELRLVVVPAVRALAALGFPAGDPFGSLVADRVLNRDLLRPIGLRAYQPGDRLRDVHWKATARLPGALPQVRVGEPVSRPAVMLVLNINTGSHVALGIDPELQEKVIALAAAVAADAVARGHPIGLAANGVVPGTGRAIRLPLSQGPATLPRLLEALAAAGSFILLPADRLVAMEARRLPWGACLAVVSAVVDESLRQELLRVARAGRRVVLMSLDPAWQGELPGIRSHHVRREALDDLTPPASAGDGDAVVDGDGLGRWVA